MTTMKWLHEGSSDPVTAKNIQQPTTMKRRLSDRTGKAGQTLAGL